MCLNVPLIWPVLTRRGHMSDNESVGCHSECCPELPQSPESYSLTSLYLPMYLSSRQTLCWDWVWRRIGERPEEYKQAGSLWEWTKWRVLECDGGEWIEQRAYLPQPASASWTGARGDLINLACVCSPRCQSLGPSRSPLIIMRAVFLGPSFVWYDATWLILFALALLLLLELKRVMNIV